MRGLLVLLAACSASRVPDVRFANTSAVRIVDDRRDVAKPPQKRVDYKLLRHYDGVFHRRISRALELPRPRRALGVNALDEVPDSTWFTNRIGVRDLTLDEVRRGPGVAGSPEAHTPWTILSLKTGGTVPGLVIRDARDVKFLFKCEMPGYPETQSASDAITSRILWAAGYNVPEDHVVYVDRRDLVPAPSSRVDVDKLLGRCDVGRDGRIRGLASRFLDGKLLGGHPPEGVRADDPNDLIPHELRRDLRGAYPIFSWIDDVDAKEANTLDVWVEDSRDPRRHYVKHYMVDFDKGIGVQAMTSRNPRYGHAYWLDFGEIFRSFASGSTADRVWERREAPPLRGVGLFEASTYDPGAWKPITPSYVPFLTADARDKFWGAKILMRFTRDQLRAIVETARYTDPRAAEYVLETLIARQRATARHWFERTSALDRFAIEDGKLCFDDLSLAYRLVDESSRYVVKRYDRRENPIASAFAIHADGRGRACMPLLLTVEGYTIVEITNERTRHAIYVHLARDPHGTPRVIGIWRP